MTDDERALLFLATRILRNIVGEHPQHNEGVWRNLQDAITKAEGLSPPPPRAMPTEAELVEKAFDAFRGNYQVETTRTALGRAVRAVLAALPPQPAAGVPADLVARMKWLPSTDVSNRYCWTDEQAGLIWEIVAWARSLPAALPVEEWQRRAREIIVDLPGPLLAERFVSQGDLWPLVGRPFRCAFVNAAALVKEIAEEKP